MTLIHSDVGVCGVLGEKVSKRWEATQKKTDGVLSLSQSISLFFQRFFSPKCTAVKREGVRVDMQKLKRARSTEKERAF